MALAVAIGAATSLGQAASEPRTGAESADGASARRTLDLVWISDSVGLYVAPVYAYWIRRDLGVRVRVHDEWEGGLPATEVLARLRRPSHRWVRLVRNAELIFVSGNARGLGTSRAGTASPRSRGRSILGRRCSRSTSPL